MARKPLTCTFYIGGKQVTELTEEQKEKMAQKLSESMSIYYTNHVEEFLRLKTEGEITDGNCE